jgi:hypothetical protein
VSTATTSAPPVTEILPDLDQVQAHFNTLNRPGEVREVRVLGHIPLSSFGGPSTASGYFDNGESVARELRGLGSHHAEGVYITQNPADPELLARANNRIKRKTEQTTADSDIIRRTRITFDFDPVRKAGISATDDELNQAIARRDAYIQFVTMEQGWSPPLVSMMSGNGAQATWPVDLPADDESTALVEAVLEASDVLFSTPEVSVDTTLSNSSRLIKLCGTVAGKGDPLAHRQHRQSRGEFTPDASIVSEAQLRALVALVPVPAPERRTQRGRTVTTGPGAAHDVAALLRSAGIGFAERSRGEMQVYRLDCCLSSDAHNDGAAIIQFPSGAVACRCHHNTCAGVGWQDVKQRLGIAKTSGGTSGSFGSAAHEQKTRDFPWPDMAALPAMTPPAPVMPAVMIPEPLRPWVRDIAELSKLTTEMVAAPAIVAAGAVVGRAVGIRPSAYDEFTAVPNLWGALIARPGWMKTDGVKEAFRPLGRLAAAAHEAYVVNEEALEATRERIEAQIDAIKRAMRDAAKKRAVLDTLENDLRAKKAELRAALATERRYLTHDATVEKLGELLRDNPRGMLVLRDELSGWLRALDKPGREGDREFFLEAWNGTGSFMTDRIGRGTVHIPALTLSLFGGIQPGKLAPLLSSAVEGGIGDDGLLQRLQVTVWPDRLPAWSKPSRWLAAGARDRAASVFAALAAMDGDAVGAKHDDIPFLRFSPNAQMIADRWRDVLEGRLRSGELDDTPAFAAHIAKYRSLMPALALVFYLIDRAAKVDGVATGVVGEAHVRLAADWCGFLEAHARKLYAVEIHAGASAAHAIAAKIEAGAVFDGQSVRELYRAQWAGLKTPERVLAGLTDLTDLGWLRVEFAVTGGRPTQVVRLHPTLVERQKTRSDGTDKTDKSPSVSFVSAATSRFWRFRGEWVPHPTVPGIRVYRGDVEASLPPDGWDGAADMLPADCLTPAICGKLGRCARAPQCRVVSAPIGATP